MAKLGSSTPAISLVAGDNTCLRLSEQNFLQPSTLDCFRPLDAFDMAADFRNQCQWGTGIEVSFISPAVLHDTTIVRFVETVLAALGRRRRVHIKLSSFYKDHGLPLDRQILILASSPLCVPFSWENFKSPHSMPERPTVANFIGDLHDANLAADIANGSDNRPESRPLVQNHETGINLSEGLCAIDFDAETVCISPSSGLTHPRELHYVLGPSKLFTDVFFLSQSAATFLQSTSSPDWWASRTTLPSIDRLARSTGQSSMPCPQSWHDEWTKAYSR